jgi:hypothetical protein
MYVCMFSKNNTSMGPRMEAVLGSRRVNVCMYVYVCVLKTMQRRDRVWKRCLAAEVCVMFLCLYVCFHIAAYMHACILTYIMGATPKHKHTSRLVESAYIHTCIHTHTHTCTHTYRAQLPDTSIPAGWPNQLYHLGADGTEHDMEIGLGCWNHDGTPCNNYNNANNANAYDEITHDDLIDRV